MTTEIKIDYKKIIISTLIKMLVVVIVVFTLNNWGQIKQSFGGDVPPLQSWTKETFTPNNLIVMVVLTVFFFFRTYVLHKKLAEKRSNYTAL